MRIGYRLTQEEATYKDKQIQNRLEVQTGNKQFAPQIISTPFFENRYSWRFVSKIDRDDVEHLSLLRCSEAVEQEHDSENPARLQIYR